MSLAYAWLFKSRYQMTGLDGLIMTAEIFFLLGVFILIINAHHSWTEKRKKK